MASTYLSRTASTPTNNKIWTWSGWVKKNFNSGGGGLFSGYQDGNNWTDFYFSGGNALEMTSYIGASTGIIVNTNAVFRDVSAWYHIVVAYDSTQTTASDRVKFYINGILQTINNTTYPSLNYETKINASSIPQQIGAGAQANFNGSMSHIHFIDGTAYDATAFGEYDANGVWKIKTSPSVTYGTNGFFILKDSASVTDQSGNGNNFTVGGGTLTDTLDCPANVFATLNPLMHSDNGQTLSNGNLTATISTGYRVTNTSTLGASVGKYYAECKIGAIGTNGVVIGYINLDKEVFQNISGTDYFPGDQAYSIGWYGTSGSVFKSQSTVLSLNTYTTGDILQFAMDLDNGYFYFGKNGTWENSGVPTSGSSGTGGYALSNFGTSGDFFTFASSTQQNAITNYNFGNGYFGTTAVASAGTNASGIGIFEYDVPTGYTALSTKGLNL